MARSLRVEYEGARYHIINRGNYRKDLFSTAKTAEYFTKVLLEASEIDFDEAQLLWEDSRAIGFPGKSDDEPRFALVAELNYKLWIAFYTIREEKIRIISVRRARKVEKELYES